MSKESIFKLQYELFGPFAILAGDTFYFDDNNSVPASKLGYAHKADFLKEYGINVNRSIDYTPRPELYGYAELKPVKIPLGSDELIIESKKKFSLLPVHPGEIIALFPKENLDLSIYPLPVANYIEKRRPEPLYGIMLYAKFGTFGSRLAELIAEKEFKSESPLQLIFKPFEVEEGNVKFSSKYINLSIRTKDIEKLQVFKQV